MNAFERLALPDTFGRARTIPSSDIEERAAYSRRSRCYDLTTRIDVILWARGS